MKIISLLMLTATISMTNVYSATTCSVLLTGTISKKLEIATDTAIANLDLTTSAADVAIANISEITNSKTGYKVTVSSTNGGKLNNSSSSEFLAYTLKYGTQTVSLVSSAAITLTNITSSTNATVVKPLKISYTAPAISLGEGSYTDSLLFSITSN
jgi:hypothetical protein